MRHMDLLATIRQRVDDTTRDLSAEALREIPAGFNNNILWNVGHLVVTQQLLHYRLSGQDMAVDQKTCDMFMKGTSPANWQEDPDYEALTTQLHELVPKLRHDYDEGLFHTFTPYSTSAGFPLQTIDDAIVFNNFHEGLHLGYIMALRRAIDTPTR